MMSRLRSRATSVLALLATMAVALPSVQGQQSQRISVGEQYLFAAANAERTARGLPPLRWDSALYAAADAHAVAMAQHGEISHQFRGEPPLQDRARDAGARFSMIAENVAEAPTAVGIHDAWMHSPPHRANLLDPTLTAIGIRVVARGGQLYAVEDFAHRIEQLSLEQQEQGASDAAHALASDLALLPATADARRTCQLESGFAGTPSLEASPAFVIHYTTSDPAHLPDSLRRKLTAGGFSAMQVAACPSADADTFTTYRLAVLLYR